MLKKYVKFYIRLNKTLLKHENLVKMIGRETVQKETVEKRDKGEWIMKEMKKNRAILAALCLLVGVMFSHVVFADQGASISVNDASGETGDTVSVTVSAKNLKDVAGITMSLSYDSSKLKLLEATDGGLFTDPGHSARSLNWGNGLSKCNTASSGIAAVLKFQLLDGFTSGSTSVTVRVVDAFDMELSDIAFAVGSASAKITAKEHVHSFGSWKETVKATCTSGGEKKRTCSKCGYEEVTQTEKTGHNAGAWETQKAATCTTKGTAVQKCTACGYKMGEKEIPLADHVYNGKEEVIKEATCSETGSKKVYCSVELCGEYKTVTIEKKAHTAGKAEITKEATCTEAGEKSVKCTVCKKVISTEVIKELGHSYGPQVVEKEATCTDAGSAYRQCTRCGVSETIDIPALGHKYGQAVVIKEATETEEGQMQTVCEVCQNAVTETIPRLSATHEHDFSGKEEVVQHATCTEKGISYQYCTVDGCDAKKTIEIPETGHTFGDWKVTKEPTEEAEGSKVRTCSSCQMTEEMSIEKLVKEAEEITPSTDPNEQTQEQKDDSVHTIVFLSVLACLGLVICVGCGFLLFRKH